MGKQSMLSIISERIDGSLSAETGIGVIEKEKRDAFFGYDTRFGSCLVHSNERFAIDSEFILRTRSTEGSILTVQR